MHNKPRHENFRSPRHENFRSYEDHDLRSEVGKYVTQ